MNILKFFIDIGTPNAIKMGIKSLVKYLKNQQFLDRDGTLIHDKGYTYKVNDLKFNNKVIKFLKIIIISIICLL